MLGEGGGAALAGSISKGGPQTEAQDIFSVASILFYTWLHVKLLMHILADVMSLCAWDNSRSGSVSLSLSARLQPGDAIVMNFQSQPFISAAAAATAAPPERKKI
jgi:hypothetical protein